MTKAQKIIKNLAIVFAIFLTITVIFSVIKIIALFGGFYDYSYNPEDMEKTVYQEEILDLDIDVATVRLTIREGESFSVETNSDDIECKLKQGKLVIEENVFDWFTIRGTGSVVITIPSDTTMRDITIDAGVGKIVVEALKTQRLDLDMGIGDVEIEQSEVNDLDLDMGIGKLELSSKIVGNGQIDFGIGDAQINLQGSLEEYSVRLEKGLGSATIAGEKMKNNTYYGTGKNVLDMDGGIGAIEIAFE